MPRATLARARAIAAALEKATLNPTQLDWTC